MIPFDLPFRTDLPQLTPENVFESSRAGREHKLRARYSKSGELAFIATIMVYGRIVLRTTQHYIRHIQIMYMSNYPSQIHWEEKQCCKH